MSNIFAEILNSITKSGYEKTLPIAEAANAVKLDSYPFASIAVLQQLFKTLLAEINNNKQANLDYNSGLLFALGKIIEKETELMTGSSDSR